MKRIGLGITLIVMAMVCVTAQQYDPESDFRARPIDGGRSVEITEYVGSNWTVNIPPQIRGLPVTHIGENAFFMKDLISITIPNSVISIGRLAFGDNQLTSVIIPNSVTTIGSAAFYGNRLISITIGENVRLIRDRSGYMDPFTNSFSPFYENNGMKAGSYTRPNANSRAWQEQ